MKHDIENVWEFVKKEAVVVLRTALPVIITLYVKRTVDKLIGSNIIDAKIIRDGITKDVPVVVKATSSPSPSIPFREGPGSKYLPGYGRLYYRAKYRTPDGYDVYDHSEEIHPRHEVSCPLLITDRGCDSCRWNIERSQYTWQSGCAAAVWLEECRDQKIGLDHFRNAMM